MTVIFAIFLATVFTNSQGKHTELLSNEEFEDELARRAGGDKSNEDNNSKQISSDESHIYIGNRNDKSYIPDIDLALTDIYLRSYINVQQKDSRNNINLNEITLPLHDGSIATDVYNENLEDQSIPDFEALIPYPNIEEKVNYVQNIPDSELSIQNPTEDHNVNQTKNTPDTEISIENPNKEEKLNQEINTPAFETITQNPNEEEKVNQEKNTPEAKTSIEIPEKEQKVDQEKNAPDFETPTQNPNEEDKANQEKFTPDSETLIKNSKEEEKVNQRKTTLGYETQDSNEKINVSPDYNPLEPETPIRVSDYEHSDTEHITEENPIIVSTTVVENTVILQNCNKSTTDIEAQAPENDSEIHIHDNDSTVTHLESGVKATESYKHDSSHSTLTDESSTDSVIDTTTNESADLFHTLDSKVFLTTTPNTAEINTATTENYNVVIENNSANEHFETILKTTTYPYIPSLTPTIEEEQITKKPKRITNTVINAINEIDRNKSDRCVYCHRVYEILWPSKDGNHLYPRSQEPIKGQSYFSPVRKYSQYFAYLKKRHGLNKVKEKKKELDKRQLRKRSDDIHDTLEVNELNEYNTNSRKFGVIKRKDKSPKISNALLVKYERQAKNIERTNVNKLQRSGHVRLFDDTNNDVLSELLHAKLGAERVDVPTIDTNKKLGNIDKYAHIDNLFDFISLRDDKAGFQNMNIRKMSNDESEINIHMNVLKYFILEDSNALKQYDWLATTVQIQSTLTKILKLISRMSKSELIHPADLQTLKYIVFLHNLYLRLKEHKKHNSKFKKRVNLLPRNKKKRKNKLLKEKGLINKIWLYLRILLPDLIEENELRHLYQFLIDVQFGLFDLHIAIRHIAEVTKFNRQNWYGNLNQLYLSTDEKHLRELLLHISMSRLVDLIERSCKQGLDNDVVQYSQSHEKETKQILEEMMFIGNIVNDIKINMK